MSAHPHSTNDECRRIWRCFRCKSHHTLGLDQKENSPDIAALEAELCSGSVQEPSLQAEKDKVHQDQLERARALQAKKDKVHQDQIEREKAIQVDKEKVHRACEQTQVDLQGKNENLQGDTLKEQLRKSEKQHEDKENDESLAAKIDQVEQKVDAVNQNVDNRSETVSKSVIATTPAKGAVGLQERPPPPVFSMDGAIPETPMRVTFADSPAHWNDTSEPSPLVNLSPEDLKKKIAGRGGALKGTEPCQASAAYEGLCEEVKNDAEFVPAIIKLRTFRKLGDYLPDALTGSIDGNIETLGKRVLRVDKGRGPTYLYCTENEHDADFERDQRDMEMADFFVFIGLGYMKAISIEIECDDKMVILNVASEEKQKIGPVVSQLVDTVLTRINGIAKLSFASVESECVMDCYLENAALKAAVGICTLEEVYFGNLQFDEDQQAVLSQAKCELKFKSCEFDRGGRVMLVKGGNVADLKVTVVESIVGGHSSFLSNLDEAVRDGRVQKICFHPSPGCNFNLKDEAELRRLISIYRNAREQGLELTDIEIFKFDFPGYGWKSKQVRAAVVAASFEDVDTELGFAKEAGDNVGNSGRRLVTDLPAPPSAGVAKTGVGNDAAARGGNPYVVPKEEKQDSPSKVSVADIGKGNHDIVRGDDKGGTGGTCGGVSHEKDTASFGLLSSQSSNARSHRQASSTASLPRLVGPSTAHSNRQTGTSLSIKQQNPADSLPLSESIARGGANPRPGDFALASDQSSTASFGRASDQSSNVAENVAAAVGRPPQGQTGSTQKNSYTCQLCGMVLTSPYGLTYHLNNRVCQKDKGERKAMFDADATQIASGTRLEIAQFIGLDKWITIEKGNMSTVIGKKVTQLKIALKTHNNPNAPASVVDMLYVHSTEQKKKANKGKKVTLLCKVQLAQFFGIEIPTYDSTEKILLEDHKCPKMEAAIKALNESFGN